MSHEALATLVAMGMDAETSRTALAMSDENVEMALELLLSGAISPHPPPMHPMLPQPPRPPPPSSPTDERVEVCALSQYTFGGGGESGCTIISLLAALEFLPQPGSSSLPLSVSAAQYEGVIGRGAAMASQGQAHLSAEEVLPRMTGLKQNGEVLSGLITAAGAYETLIDAAVAAAASGSPVNNTYCAIVLTKPPESVCLSVPLVPATTDRAYILLDSHARPQLGLSGAYIVSTPSKESICRRLRLLFPPFPLPDLDEYQQLLYNGVDGTCVSRTTVPDV